MPRCRRCHRVLKTDAAREAGYGAVCFRKIFGKPLPSGKVPRDTGNSQAIPTRRRETRQSKLPPVEPIPLFAEDVCCYLSQSGEHVTNVPQRIVYHSPDGFSWGYGGSGPADLALNILSLFAEEQTAYELHQDFKRQFIESMPQEGGKILKTKILEWIEQKRSERNG